MKCLKLFVALAALFFCGLYVSAQEFRETIRETYTAPGVVYLANVNGSVAIHGTRAREVSLEAEKTLSAKNVNLLGRAKSEVRLKSIQRGDTLLIFLDLPFLDFGYSDGRWRYNWEQYQQQYDFDFDFRLEVPDHIPVYVSTINRGEIFVKDMLAEVRARNINGNIRLEKIAASIDVHTINGDVWVDFLQNPEAACRFYTLNGDIEVYFDDGLSSEVSFKSFNGDLFMQYDYEVLPRRVRTIQTEKGRKTKYKIEAYTHLRIAGGGPLLAFETFNGNAYLKKKSH